MERLFYQQEWQGIPLREIGRVPHSGVADRRFYEAFYRRLLSEGHRLSQAWVEEKHRVAQWLLRDCLSTVRQRQPLRVLSVGAGLGVIERHLWDAGVHVDALDCESASLRASQASCPGIHRIVGDARAIPCRSAQYGLVYLANVDYCFPRTDYVTVLREVCRTLHAEGLAVLLSTSNLSWPRMLGDRARQLLSRRGGHDGTGSVPWGYQRSVAEHLRAGRMAGLVCDRVCVFDPTLKVRAIRRWGALHLGWPTLRDGPIAAVFRKPMR